MSRVKHNALHQFAAGLNNQAVNGPDVPFPTPGMQNWKWVIEDFANGILWTADNVQYELTVEGVTPAPVVAANGVSLPTLASDNTSTLLQWTTPNLQVGANTKRFWLETSVTLTAAAMASNEAFIGFTSDQQGTNFVAADGLSWTFDDGFGFGKLDAATEIDFIARQSDVEQTVGLGSTFVTAARVTLACYYDGVNYQIFKDGELVVSSAQEVFNDDAAIGVSAYCKSGTAAIQSLLVNYVAIGTEL